MSWLTATTTKPPAPMAASCTASVRAGDYLLELRRHSLPGRRRLLLSLEGGDFPLVTAAYPLGVQKGSRRRIEATGPSAGEALRVEANAPADLDDDELNLKVQ